MAPKDFSDSSSSSFMHEDDHASCSSCEDVAMTPKKSVHFNPSCQLKLYTMPTAEDQLNAWYTASEYQQFKTTTKLVAKAARQRQTLAGEEMTVGLETGDKKRADLKLQRRYAVWDLVLDGQEKNQHPLQIANDCATVSDASAEDAQKAATLLHASIIQEEMPKLRMPRKQITPDTRVLLAPVSRVA